jgi:Integrase core domain/Chromo (CHRromatin Organisation MOdifier) domain
MNEIYFTPSHPGSFGGVHNLTKHSRKTTKVTKEWLSKQDAYTLHKPVLRKFPRRKTYSSGIDDLWQSDLVDISIISKHNDGMNFLLTAIDVFSKYAFVIPLKNKKATTVRDAFATLISERKPNYLQTDKGSEFINETFQRYLRENDIKFYTSENEDIKCAIVERFHRTLKSKMYRYFTHKSTLRYLDILPALVSSYNNAYHRSIKSAPSDVTIQNEPTIRKHLFPPKKFPIKYKFKVGDTVRISEARRVFKKGYLPNWTVEIFTVSSLLPTQPPTYSIVDYQGEAIKGKFYAEELQKVIKEDNTYKVEKVLQTRKKAGKTEYFVKWIGYPSKFNSWVSNIMT